MAALKVLYLTHRVPYAPNRGDRVRAYHVLHELAGHAEVTLVSLAHDEAEAAAIERVRHLVSRGVAVRVPWLANYIRAVGALGTNRSLTTTLLNSPSLLPAVAKLVAESPPDVVLAYCSSMASVALEGPLREFPLVVDMVDADSEKWRALAERRRGPSRWVYRREARTLAELETKAVTSAYATVAVNAREVATLRRLAPQGRIEVVGLGVDVAGLAPPEPPTAAPRVVFTGVMNYGPNEEGAIWLARQVWPNVRRQVPTAELRIVGASPTRRVKRLANVEQGIVVTGTVDDIRPELWSAAVATAPLLVARGVQNKVLEAIAAGLPCVVTPAVHAGLPPEVTAGFSVADDARSFSEAVVQLLRKEPEARREAARSDLAALAWSSQLAPLLPLLRAAAETARA